MGTCHSLKNVTPSAARSSVERAEKIKEAEEVVGSLANGSLVQSWKATFHHWTGDAWASPVGKDRLFRAGQFYNAAARQSVNALL